LTVHHANRYLGDLFGGQMMGGMATRTLGLEEGKGIAFYQFPAIPDNKAFIEEWYGALNELPLSAEQKQAIVDEANLVFAFNIELFSELEGNALQAMFALAWSSLKSKLGLDASVA
jgi:heme oxygenase